MADCNRGRWLENSVRIAAACAILIGCASAKNQKIDAQLAPHVVVTDKAGHLDDGLLGKGLEAGLTEAFIRFAKDYQLSSKRRLLFFLNGGLNGINDSISRAKQQWSIIQNTSKEEYYPVFLVWPTPPIESYFEEITYVRHGIRSSNPHYYSAPFYALGDIAEGLGNLPVTAAASTRDYIQTYLLRDESIYTLKEDRNLLVPDGAAIDAEHYLVFDPARADEPASAPLDNLVYTVATPARLLLLPFTDSLGRTAWEQMVRRTRTMIRRDIEFNPDPVNDAGPKPAQINANQKQKFPAGTGAIARFFQYLAACSRPEGDSTTAAPPPPPSCPDAVDAEMRNALHDAPITLIGHSMGAIAANELITLLPDLPWERIVYMAAAASIRDTARAVVPLLLRNEEASRHPKTRFFNLMLHPINDAREHAALGVLPAGSLLALVDDLFERPKSPLDRTMGRWSNLRYARHVFPTKARKWMLWRVFDRAPNNLLPEPVRHGDFNDLDHVYWEPGYWGACGRVWADGEVLCR